jgi:hypothetical protein
VSGDAEQVAGAQPGTSAGSTEYPSTAMI